MATSRRTRLSTARIAGASLFALAAAYGALMIEKPRDVPFEVLLVSLVVASGLFWRREFGAQVLARALCWCAGAWGFMVVFVDAGRGTNGLALAITLASGAALLSAGRDGMRATNRVDSRFTPAAFSGPLIAGLVLAVADLQTLAISGSMAVQHTDYVGMGITFFVGAALMLVAIIGVYQLKLWGIALNLVANVAIATYAIVMDVPKPIAWALSLTAALQFALPIPMLVRMIRGDTIRETAPGPIRLAIVPVTLVALMVLVTVVAVRDLPVRWF